MGAIDASFSASFFREPLFNNATFEVARMGDPMFAGKLHDRYELFAEGLPQQMNREIRMRSKGGDVTAVALVGDSAGHRAYDGIDVNVLLTGGTCPMFRAHLKVSDEKHSSVSKLVTMNFFGDNRLSPQTYIKWFFPKPIIYGAVPVLFDGKLPPHILNASKESLWGFQANMPDRKKKATQYLIESCRSIFTYCHMSGTPIPQDFEKTVKLLHTMDYQGSFDEPTLKAIRYIIENWDLQELSPGQR